MRDVEREMSMKKSQGDDTIERFPEYAQAADSAEYPSVACVIGKVNISEVHYRQKRATDGMR